MCVEANGGGMSGSFAGREKEKGSREIPHSLSPSTDEDGELEAESTAERRSALDCPAALETSLPIKRGLSSHYYGRSKSFGNLTDLSIEHLKDLGKKEHAIKKRRRLLNSHDQYCDKQLHDGGATSSITHAASMPAFLPDYLKNEDEENEDKKKGSDGKNQ